MTLFHYELRKGFILHSTDSSCCTGLRLRRCAARTVLVVAEAVEAVGTQPFPRGAARTTVVVAEASRGPLAAVVELRDGNGGWQ